MHRLDSCATKVQILKALQCCELLTKSWGGSAPTPPNILYNNQYLNYMYYYSQFVVQQQLLLNKHIFMHSTIQKYTKILNILKNYKIY